MRIAVGLAALTLLAAVAVVPRTGTAAEEAKPPAKEGAKGAFRRHREPGPPEVAPTAKDDAEKQILQVLEDIPKQQGRHMNVPPTDGRMLRLLTEAMGAKKVVEIGTSNGISGIWFALALRSTGGKLITHDINPDAVAMARKNFATAGVGELIEIVQGDAHQTLSQLKGPIDLAFIDADKQGYLDYLQKLLPLVRPGGLIVCHNVPGMVDQEFMQALTTNPQLETRFYVQGEGMSISLKKR